MSMRSRLLVVAEDDQIRRTTASLLRACNAGEVSEASTGGAALEAALSGLTPDVLLLDTRLASPSATEICRQVRAQRTLRQPDIWLLAPAGSTAPVAQALEAGADDCLALPVVPQLLKARLQVTEGRRQRSSSPSRFHEALAAAEAEASGELVVREMASRRVGRIYFHASRVAWVHVVGEPSRLNDVLAGVASLDEEQERAVLDLRRRGTPLGDALEQAGIIERSRWRSTLQAWLRKRLQTVAAFAPSSSVFLPQELRLEDDVSFSVAELMGDVDGGRGTPRISVPPPSDGRSGALTPPASVDPEVTAMLGACMGSGLVESVAVLERGTGQCLGAAGESLDAFAVWTHLNHVTAVSARDGFDSFAMTTTSSHQLTLPLPGQPNWLLFASYSRSRGPLGVAFTDLRLALSRLGQR